MRQIVVFTRYPEPGKTKTRLIPGVGALAAAKLQRRMTEHALDHAKEASRMSGYRLSVAVSGGTPAGFRNWLGRDVVFCEQVGSDLGEKMRAACVRAFEKGAKACVVVGIDCPTITPDVYADAFSALETHDVAIGPALDGGYYLVGVTKRAGDRGLDALFSGIDWGTESVLAVTQAQLSSAGLTLELLKPMGDVDEPEDIALWEEASQLNSLSRADPRVSVIIPALNEESELPRTLDRLELGENIDVILVDGGSDDATCEIAESAGVRVVHASGGRAAQMNAGVEASRGEILLFVHADTRMPVGYDSWIRRGLQSGVHSGGAFEMGIEGAGFGLRFVEILTNLRVRLFKLPYGDQAIFVKRSVFDDLGGYASMPLMEDFDFMRRFKRRWSVWVVPSCIATSSRRWSRLGAFRTTLLNQWMIVGYFLGVPIEKLALWYRSAGRRGRE